MTELVTSDVHRPARVILLTLVVPGVGSSGKHQADSGWIVAKPEVGQQRASGKPMITGQSPRSRLRGPLPCTDRLVVPWHR